MTHPVETAVLPLKIDAVARAEKNATEYAARLLATLEAAGMNLDLAFPYGDSMRDNRVTYLAKVSLHNLVSGLTTNDTSIMRLSYKDPDIRAHDPDGVARFIKGAKEDAAAQYDLFVAKLVRKIGNCEQAELSGNHVWGYSILRVVKLGFVVERWKTQQIVNVSKLGKLFNQWPSRKMK